MKQMPRVQSIPILFIYLVKVGLIKFSSSFNFTERTNLYFSRYIWSMNDNNLLKSWYGPM